MKEKKYTWAPFIVVAWSAGVLREWRWRKGRRWQCCGSHCKYICITHWQRNKKKKIKLTRARDAFASQAPVVVVVTVVVVCRIVVNL